MKGPGVVSEFELKESQEVIFILRQMPDDPPEHETPSQFRLRMVRDPPLSVSLMEALFRQTAKYWQNWISGSSYKGRWRENVLRSALTLKLLTYEPVCKFS
jgi:GH15 family glucan-1,4-alpha-glucosidase